MNYLKIIFGQLTLTMVLLGGLINNLENYLPVFIVRSFRYGKFACKKSTSGILKPIELPKSSFKHFYIHAAVVSTIVMYLTINIYILNNPIPGWFNFVLDISAGSKRYASVTPAATFLAATLLSLQSYRRAYETHFVSVFGKNVKINLIHYIVGYIHYTGAFIAILCEAPKFATTNSKYLGYNSQLKLDDISYLHISGAVLFLWAWWNQYKANNILGNLRKNTNGKVISQKHHIPEGDLFTYVSSPHMFTEILMYVALSVILWQHSTFHFVTIWVISNQVETAFLTHKWYKETFPNYPKERKALIPFIF